MDDEQIQKLVEFKEAFQKLTTKKGWTLNQFSHQIDDEGFFISVTLKWAKPSEIDRPL